MGYKNEQFSWVFGAMGYKVNVSKGGIQLYLSGRLLLM